MSNLGFLSIFHLLNSHPLASCERVTLPTIEETAQSKKRGAALRSLESGKDLLKFDVIAFSISFENDYVNVAKMLTLAGIPLLAKERDERHPIIIAGGIATILNPEPIADFIDLFLLGDDPLMISDFVDMYVKLRGAMPKEELIAELSVIEGAYVPALYEVEYNDGTIKGFKHDVKTKPRITPAFSSKLTLPAYSYIISKDALFKDMFLIEISRGCKRFCRFCAASYNYLPYKTLSADEIVKIIDDFAGDRKVGLVGAAVSDYRQIDDLCEKLISRGKSFSVSSFRADSLSPALMRGLSASGHKTLTIAPEAGSQRLRDIIKKGITENDILSAAKRIATSGILNVKLYFIIGLPFETDDDIEQIITLTKKIRDIFLEASKALKRAGQVSVSLSPFVPKPNTPFYVKGMAELSEIRRKSDIVRDGLKKESNITLENVPVRDAELEALFSRGDRRLAALIKLLSEGKNLKQSAKETGIDIDFYVHRDIGFDEILPFALISPAMRKDLLIKEYDKAARGAKLADKQTGTTSNE